jgi:hypothetical protein
MAKSSFARGKLRPWPRCCSFTRFAFFAACVSARVMTISRSDAETLMNQSGNMGVFYRLNELFNRCLFVRAEHIGAKGKKTALKSY